jgi:hypothetical protein
VKQKEEDVYHSPQNEYEKLLVHPFIQDCVKNGFSELMPVYLKIKDTDPNTKITSKQKYHVLLFPHVQNMMEASKKLFDISFYIWHNPKLEQLTKNGIQPQEWFVYHYSNYVVTACTVLDTAHYLSAAIFELKTEEQRIENVRRSLENNPVYKESAVKDSLLDLKSIIQKFKKERNPLIHEGQKPEIDFVEKLDQYRLSVLANAFKISEQVLPSRRQANFYFISHVRTQNKHLQEETRKIYNSLNDLFSALHLIYQQRSKNFDKENAQGV